MKRFCEVKDKLGAIRVIIQQQISLRAAYAITGALVKIFGEKTKLTASHIIISPHPKHWQRLTKTN